MELSTPQSAVLALVSFVGDRLAAVGNPVGNTLGARRAGRSAGEIIQAGDEHACHSAPRVATVVVAAAPTFAPTPYARARLLRQMHAGGLLIDAPPISEARQSAGLLGVAR